MPEENFAGAEGRSTPRFLAAVAAFKLAADVRRSRVVAVAVPIGCLQPVGLAPDLVALGPACCSAASKKRTFDACANITAPLHRDADLSETKLTRPTCAARCRHGRRRRNQRPAGAVRNGVRRRGNRPFTPCHGKVSQVLGGRGSRVVYSSEFVTDWGGRAASHDAVREHNPPMAAPLPRLGAVERLEDNASPRHALSSLRGVLARRVYEARSSKPYGGGRNDGRRLVQRAFKRTATPTDALESGELPTLKAPMMCIMSAGFKRVGMALGCLCGSWGG